MPDKDRKAAPKEKGKDKEPVHSPAWERVLLARHLARPHTLDFIAALTKDFVELHGDRRFGDDPAMVGGVARFEGRPVMVIGQQKGHDTKENIARNFGLPKPEGYRKALRLMQQAAKFKLPILSFIDVQGAFPGKESEERGVAQAIAESLMIMSRLPVPIIAMVTGEGGSGGAIAISVADRLFMLENSVYSVVSPEGCAAILWRDASQAPAAAQAMKITATDLLEFGVIDGIIPEPAGGAHTDIPTMMQTVRETLRQQLAELDERYVQRGPAGIAAMLEDRYAKYRQIGRWTELVEEQLGMGRLEEQLA